MASAGEDLWHEGNVPNKKRVLESYVADISFCWSDLSWIQLNSVEFRYKEIRAHRRAYVKREMMRKVKGIFTTIVKILIIILALTINSRVW